MGQYINRTNLDAAYGVRIVREEVQMLKEVEGGQGHGRRKTDSYKDALRELKQEMSRGRYGLQHAWMSEIVSSCLPWSSALLARPGNRLKPTAKAGRCRIDGGLRKTQ